MNQDTFIEPVGSIPMTTDLPTQTNDSYDVVGRGGKVRHSGNFSPNNPYLAQLQVATSNQDKDALYELAVQWEADYANLNEQRAYNRQVLEEQRQYDSPEAQVARQRAAGINPDLAGTGSSGSGSGSSAQMQLPAMADQTGQTKFSNAYDNTSLVFEGINTAANVASALTSGVSGIMNAVSNLKTVPSHIALNEANAGLAGAKANEIDALLAGKKKGVDLSNVAQGIQNSTATLQQLAEFSNLISPDTADFAPILKSLGVSEENVAPYSDIIKQMHANPQMRDKYAKASVAAKWSEAENSLYTDAVVSEMTDLGYKIQYEQQYWQFNTSQLKNKISGLLNTDEFAQQTASNEIGRVIVEGNALGLSNDEIALRTQQLKTDTEAYLNGLADRAATLEVMDKTIASLQASDQSNSPQVKAQIDRIRAEKIGLRNLLASEFNQIKSHYLSTAQQYYHRNTVMRLDGTIRDEGAVAKYNYFSDLTFNDLVYHRRTAGEIAKGWVDSTIDAAGVVVDAAGVARGFNFNNTYRDVHGSAARNAGYNAGWAAAQNYYE